MCGARKKRGRKGSREALRVDDLAEGREGGIKVPCYITGGAEEEGYEDGSPGRLRRAGRCWLSCVGMGWVDWWREGQASGQVEV